MENDAPKKCIDKGAMHPKVSTAFFIRSMVRSSGLSPHSSIHPLKKNPVGSVAMLSIPPGNSDFFNSTKGVTIRLMLTGQSAYKRHSLHPGKGDEC